MRIAIALAAVSLIAFTDAAAAHHRCGHGQILRVSMGVCVGARSHLARVAYSRHWHHPRLAALQPAHKARQEAQDGQTPRPATPMPSTTPAPASEAPVTPAWLPDPFGRSIMARPVTSTWRIAR